MKNYLQLRQVRMLLDFYPTNLEEKHVDEAIKKIDRAFRKL